jgi:hypothetical protein
MTDQPTPSAAALPDKLSALIRVAVADMRKVQADPRYELDARTWHEPRDTDDNKAVCAVCMAGAVMANTLSADLNDDLSIGDFGDDADKLDALDDVRGGFCDDAVARVRGFDVDGDARGRLTVAELRACADAGEVIVATYDQSVGFASLESYEAAADILEKAGL